MEDQGNKVKEYLNEVIIGHAKLDQRTLVNNESTSSNQGDSRSNTGPITLTGVEQQNIENFGFPCAIKDSSDTGIVIPTKAKRSKVVYTAPESGQSFYKVPHYLCTPPIVPKLLPEAFADFPIYGKPELKSELGQFYENSIKKFVGTDLNDAEFESLAEYCSPDHLKTGREMILESKIPVPNFELRKLDDDESVVSDGTEEEPLCVLRKYNLRVQKDVPSYFPRKLKYRGVKLWPLTNEHEDETISTGKPLEPGKDVLFKIRIYRTFPSSLKLKQNRFRHSVLSTELVVCGWNQLRELRARIVCPNDIGSRTDVSLHPHMLPNTSARDIFPSGFLFVNNVFYVDCREGYIDYSKPIREWAESKGIGKFEVKDLEGVLFQDLTVKLGFPEVYVHQGDCEHLFTFSQIRLVNVRDPLSTSYYPVITAVSQNQTMYCTTCAEFGAKWVVVGCPKVPFDPAFFCDICFKLYLYKDGRKICDFKAYSFKGNEINLLKPSE